MIDVLHVPYTYFPDRTGGTETYVAALIAGLRVNGINSAVAAPIDVQTSRAYVHEGTQVHRFAHAEASLRLDDQYGLGDPVAASDFATLLARVKPRIVHLHAWTSGISLRVLRAAHAGSCRVVFTYHTPAVSCARGSMMIYGRSVCDGALFVNRCCRCVLQQHGIPLAIGALLGEIPPAALRVVSFTGLAGGPATALQMSRLIALRHDAFRALLLEADAIVAVQDWVHELLLFLGAPREKLTLSRLAPPTTAETPITPDSAQRSVPRAGALRIAFFGRIDESKGIHVVIDALREIGAIPIRFDVYGAPQGREGERYLSRLRRLVADDGRVQFLDPVPTHTVTAVMRQYDVVVVPSVWMETGPLVVPEAMSVGVPVIGSDLGGIPSFVRNGVDGILVPPGDSQAWAAVLRRVAEEPGLLETLAKGVRPPETMARVVAEMLTVYSQVTAA